MLSREVQAVFPIPIWHISIDHFRDSGIPPMGRFDGGDFSWAEYRSNIFDGFHNALSAYANSGNNLIVEHILDDTGWIDSLRTLFVGHDVLFVGVYCSLPLLIEREKQRGDRKIGMAQADFETVHKGRRYDLEISSEEPLETNISEIIAFWKNGIRTSEFAVG